MKTTKKHFELFKSECEKWIDIFELNNWEVNIKQDELEDDIFANCRTYIGGYVSEIRMNTKIDKEFLVTEKIKQYAKHEVIHLLLGRFSEQGRSRYVNSSEISEAEEELVRKLEKIIQ